MTETNQPHVELTSLSLLERVREREPEAWRKLVQIYGPLVLSWVRFAGLDDASASDVSQEVWQSVSGAFEQFRRDPAIGTFRGWLWTITRNKVNDSYRRNQPIAAGGTDAYRKFQELPQDEPPDESKVQDYQLLHRALELIRPDFEATSWKAFWRMAVDGQTATEVGIELDMTANAVHQAKFRILRRLRQEMAGLVEA